MLLAKSVSLGAVLARLSGLRPVFHSEADFHQAFAWEVRSQDPTVRVRLETRPAPGIRLDLLLTSANGLHRSAVELKYLTRLWAGEHAGERFELKDQGAQDIRAYDVVKDIVRVETFVGAMPGSNGAMVCIVNDPSYWNAAGHGRVTNAEAFRLHEGTVLHGMRAWGPRTGVGTTRGREEPLVLAGMYTTAWADYSVLPGPRGLFRALVVEVPGG